ncbi:DNA-binding response regulator [Micromonospora endophytica]|uniref:DNA-binding response regulator n=2 Tax=Micromonospora endophytica TaxID=515350 RepID=A0A2W2C3I4_9ACTN|nr:response regulator transcription factor [Micromonospora endophytica]PZF93082.1 DNA-binding response regulator [Micromonospora endophytica]RIW45721.1 DNA-binding response regulator [Micromonospora endophytica]
MRVGFRMILEAQPDITVVADVADGQAAVEAARRLRPDVCVLDIRMPVLDGLQVTRLLAGPDVADPIPVVVITMFDDDEYVDTALQYGASGFLLKDCGPALLVEAVRAAVRGDTLVAPQVTVRLLRHFRHRPQVRAAIPVESLTDRESDVVRAVARGLTNQEIAAELFVAVSTVKTHLAAAQSKLGVRNRVEVASWAWRAGLVDA